MDRRTAVAQRALARVAASESDKADGLQALLFSTTGIFFLGAGLAFWLLLRSM